MNRLGKLWRGMLRAAPIRLWAMMLAGPVMLAVALWMLEIIRAESWPLTLRAEQLKYIGWAFIGLILINGIIIVTLAAVKVRGSGPGGLALEIDADDSLSPGNQQ